jgi:eukaryotic-like serine/threonine-protein kinase
MLRRPIWIHLREITSTDLPSRHDLSRSGRLRWLSGGNLGSERWDAYEALTGSAFRDLITTPQPWNAVRFWLTHLAEELAAAQNDEGYATTMSLDRIWITASGRAVLLDFAAPMQREHVAGATYSGNDAVWVQAFLSDVAAEALHCTRRAARIPLHARQFLDSLRRGAFDKVEYIVGNLHSLLTKPAEITRQRRIASLALVPALATIIGMILAGLVVFEQIRSDRIWRDLYPDRPSMRLAARIYGAAQDDEGPAAEETKRVAGIYMAKHFPDVLANATLWANPDFGDAELYRRDLKSAIDNAPLVSAEEAARVEQTMTGKLQEKMKEDRILGPLMVIGTELFFILFSTATVLLSVLIFGVNPVLQLFGLTVVTRDGRRAGRGRLLLRWLVTWSVPAFLACLAGTLGMVILSKVVFDHMPAIRGIVLIALPLLGLLMLAGSIVAILRPNRGVQDLICGTCIVPK